MVISSDSAVNKKIVQMRKNGSYITTIHNWLIQWDNFSELDEIVVLCHICSVLNEANIAVSRNEVRKCVNQFFSKQFHQEKVSYLKWIYDEYKVKDKTRVFTSQIRKKPIVPSICSTKQAHSEEIENNSRINQVNTGSALNG